MGELMTGREAAGRLKVGISVTTIQGGRSGVGVYIFGLIEGLRKAAPEIEIHLFGRRSDQRHFEKWKDSVRWHSVPDFCSNGVLDILWHHLVLLPRMWILGIQVVHIPTYRRSLAFAPCVEVLTVHDLAPFHVKRKYSLLRMFYARRVVPFLVRRAARIMTVSRATREDVLKFCGVDEGKVAAVYNGIDHSVFRPSAAGARRFEFPYFLYIARLEHPAKNHIRLIEAFELFHQRTGGKSPHRLVLGGADWHGADEIHARIRSSSVKDRIVVLGFVDAAELPALYREAEALVFPSLFEGFGLPLIEAMACGCPVISSTQGSLDEVLGEVGVRIDPFSPPDMAAALQRVAGFSPEERAAAISSGISRAGEFDWELCGEAAARTYRMAAGEVEDCPSPGAASMR